MGTLLQFLVHVALVSLLAVNIMLMSVDIVKALFVYRHVQTGSKNSPTHNK